MASASSEIEKGISASERVGELLDAPDFQLSADERQAALLDEIRQLHVVIETTHRDLMRVVAQAQRQGVSWSKIGEAQGVSAQAAQQKSKRWRAQQADKTITKEQGVSQ